MEHNEKCEGCGVSQHRIWVLAGHLGSAYARVTHLSSTCLCFPPVQNVKAWGGRGSEMTYGKSWELL